MGKDQFRKGGGKKTIQIFWNQILSLLSIILKQKHPSPFPSPPAYRQAGTGERDEVGEKEVFS
jgi:hypothetical protein